MSWLIFNEISSQVNLRDISHRPLRSHGGDFQQFLKNLICLHCPPTSPPNPTSTSFVRSVLEPSCHIFGESTSMWQVNVAVYALFLWLICPTCCGLICSNAFQKALLHYPNVGAVQQIWMLICFFRALGGGAPSVASNPLQNGAKSSEALPRRWKIATILGSRGEEWFRFQPTFWRSWCDRIAF